MEQAGVTEPVQSVERKRKHTRRWMPGERRQKIQDAMGEMLRLAGQIIPGFVLCFADVMGIPSGLHAAYMAAQAMQGESLLWPACGSLLALLMRLIWGLPLRLEMMLAALLMLPAPSLIFGKGMLRLMGCTALSLLPGCVWSMAAGTAAQVITSLGGIAISALSAPVILRALRVLREDRPAAAMEERVSVGYLCGILLCGAGRMVLFGVNLGALGAAAVTLGMGMFLGAGPAVLAGMMGGLTLAMQGLPMELAVALSMGGFLSGMVQCLGRRWICCCGFAAGCCLPMILMGVSGYGCMMAAVCATVGFLCLSRGQMSAAQRLCRRFMAVPQATGDGYACESLRRWEKVMADMAGAVPVPDAEEGPRTASWWKCRLCAGCPDDADCTSLLTELARDHAESVWKARTQKDDAWRLSLENLRGLGCGRLYYLRESMDALRREDAQRVRECIRLKRQRDMLVTHLTAMSQAARRFAQLSSGESWWDEMSARQLRRALAEGAYAASLVYARQVQGHARVCYELQRETGMEAQAEELLRLTRRVLGIPMQLERAENGRVRLEEAPLWHTECAVACQGADGDEVCGDTPLRALLPGGIYLTALSDGMGHGESARQESRHAVQLLRLCLEAGYTRQQALTAVNGMMILSSRGERFATVDMALVDLWTGRVMLDKLGAAASWLIRGREMQEITGEGLPLGMLEDVESQGMCLRLKDGDQLLMMTDGVEESFGDRERLKDALMAAADAQDASGAAWTLLHRAEEEKGPGGHDDRTVAVLRFSKTSTVQSPSE